MNISRTKLRGIVLAAGLCALSLAAHAQSTVTIAKVPFEFAAGGRMMPAGSYTIETPDFEGVLVLRGVTGNTVALLTAPGSGVASSPSVKLIFERRDGMAYLSAVEWPEKSAQIMSAFKPITKGAIAAALH